ncbi:sedoheptulose--bisphosphatase [Stylonychia lemnae]|uniref:Sedoheptulose--bisphosphatase n=1 Tax=Stylonychia lemnae TaxID=5949 RepID=A0A077ZSM9_STYLE|nr:sedoheptulose--bisphosphatase [Stylonychia lemnae]|eukprot:CDW72877.1 sedoheptulose--bisphosphatase [Stylonychia lemnae]
MENTTPLEILKLDGELGQVYQGILEACKEIAEHLRYSTSNKIQTTNDFGDVQLDQDVQTDSLIFEALKNTGMVYAGLSEERSYVTQLDDNGKYIVTFDPLDGSSIIDTNFTIGSIFAIWPKGDLNEMTGRKIVGAALALYGSRTNILIYNPDTEQVDEATLQKTGENELQWVISQKNIRIRTDGRYFSPGNTRSIQYNKGYRDCIQFWSRNGYILRYSGGMAPDCYHIFKKGEGVFSSVSGEPKVTPKLRLLYECAPISYLCEKAGGLSSDGTQSVLDIQVKGYTQKCDIIIGSREEVERVERFLQNGKSQQ